MNARTPVLVLAALLASACTSSKARPPQFAAFCAPTDTCSFTSSCAAQYIGLVQLDVSLPSNHVWLFAQFDNPLPPNPDVESGRVNNNDAHITSFDVTYSGLPLISGSKGHNYMVPAGGSATVSVFAIPDEVGLNLKAQVGSTIDLTNPVRVTATVTPHGYYENGNDFDGGEFPITVEVCDGCVPILTCAAPTTAHQTCPPDSLGQLPVAESCVTP